MGISYLKLYQLLHANEKPLNFSQVKNYEKNMFVNTELIMDFSDNIKKEELIYMKKKNRGSYEKKTEKMVTLQKDLQKELQKGDIHYGSNIKYSSELVIGYLYRKFPASYSVAQRILREILNRFP